MIKRKFSYTHFCVSCVFALMLLFFTESRVSGQDELFPGVNPYSYRSEDSTVIGTPKTHTVREEDTFYDIARTYSLGLNELRVLYPETDPWMPPEGDVFLIPSFWVLPDIKKDSQMIVNIPEMRLYFFDTETSHVQTYPVSIGSEDYETPEGIFSISEKRTHPTWHIPKSLQEKYGMAIMPPGPENPLGEYVMRFSNTSYSIHGTHMPWGVGMQVSHGCIRCYPEHIRYFYHRTALGTKVQLIYEPIKFGVRQGRVFVEIHPDVYQKIPDFEQYALKKLKSHPLVDQIDLFLYQKAVGLKNGVPTQVSLSQDNGISKFTENRAFQIE